MSGIAALLGGLGIVGVAFGLLSALLAIFQPVTDLSWILANLTIGVLLLSASLFIGFDSVRERLRSDEARRVGRYGSNAAVAAVLWLGVLAMLGFLAQRHPVRFDWSEDKVNTLTEQTLGLLARAEQPITFRAFFTRSERPAVTDLLTRYEHASDRIELLFVDPNSIPGVIEDMGLDPEELARGLVRVEIGEAAMGVSEFSEPNLTNAILKLQQSSGKKVYFLTGHNEREIAKREGDQHEGKESVARAAAALRNETYTVEALDLGSLGAVPDDADVVVIAGPTQPYFEHEIVALRDYVARGGAALVLLDPRAQTNLYPLLAEWGIRLGDDVVVDQALAVFGQATSPFAGSYAPNHPITAKLRERTIFPMVRSVESSADGPGQFVSLVQTGPDSWAERGLDEWRKSGRAVRSEGDLVGPVSIALAGTLQSDAAEGQGDASEAAAEPARIVVFGDSDFISNEFIDALRNRDLMLNSVNWLLGDIEQISVRPHLARASRFQLDSAQFHLVQMLSLFVLPEAIAIVGVVVWWRRRETRGL